MAMKSKKDAIMSLTQKALLQKLTDIEKAFKEKRTVMKENKNIQQDLFLADEYAILNDFSQEMTALGYPIFALKSSKEERLYQKDGFALSIRPGLNGTPTIYDADVWVYAISKLIKAVNKGETIHRTIRFTAYDFLKITNRDTSKKEYERLIQSLQRLHETTLTTTHEWSKNHIKPKFLPVDVDKIARAFHFIDEYVIGRDKKTKKMDYIEITLPNWLFEAVEKRAVLKLSPKYFLISSPLHRRLYEIARRLCGSQDKAFISLKQLKERTGSTGDLRKFRYNIKQLKDTDMPDYVFTIDEKSDIVLITPKKEATHED